MLFTISQESFSYVVGTIVDTAICCLKMWIMEIFQIGLVMSKEENWKTKCLEKHMAENRGAKKKKVGELFVLSSVNGF